MADIERSAPFSTQGFPFLGSKTRPLDPSTVAPFRSDVMSCQGGRGTCWSARWRSVV